jgi:carbonic anhydrase
MNPGSERIAVLACMDARLDAAGYLDGRPEPVHIVRNAGGRVTLDVLRSLAVSCTTGIDRILVFHHTKCAMVAHTDVELRKLLPSGAKPEMHFFTIDDPDEALRRDLRLIKGSTLLPPGIEVRGFIYDLDLREAREIDPDSVSPAP